MQLLRIALFGIVLFEGLSSWGEEPPPWVGGSIEPAWAHTEPERVIRLKYDSGKSARANGRALAEALRHLRPGDRLEVDSGHYVMASRVTLDLAGTAERPIVIAGRVPGDPPRITRLDAGQNLFDVGARRPARYLALRHLELEGGSVVIRFYDSANLWLDCCELHHSAHGGITANSRDTHHLFITRNHFHDFHGGTGEAMYLGANRGKVVMRDSVIAMNLVHDCGGEQGDGIELKQGSYNNWIVSNRVHDTKYPCIIVYGTGGKGINVVERNICYRSRDNTMQIQGEAVVRNNLIMAARGAAFASIDHQGKTRTLVFVHNTLITERVGANLSSWNGREGMVFANNAVYSRAGKAIRFPHGSTGVTVTGNVVFGSVEGAPTGWSTGRGLSDFESVDWNGRHRQAVPAANSMLLRAADPRFAAERDLTGKRRTSKRVAGALLPR